MDFKFANAVATVISALFPGGIVEFNKRGQITILPHPSKEIVVFHPELPEDIKSRLIALQGHPNNKTKNTIHFMTVPNFSALDSEQLRDNDAALVAFFNKVDPSAGVLFENQSKLIVVTLPTITSDEDEALLMIFGHLKTMEGMALCYVVTGKSVFQVEPDPNRRKPSVKADEHPKMISSPPIDRGVISRDDITNLIIELQNSRSIDDLINGA